MRIIVGVVRFKDLGRQKASGAFPVKARDEDEFNNILLGEFSKYLISSDISFSNGKIYAGFYKVGTFEFIAKEVSK
jgi:hypothetical protein